MVPKFLRNVVLMVSVTYVRSVALRLVNRALREIVKYFLFQAPSDVKSVGVVDI
jgi:hypothetical protein